MTVAELAEWAKLVGLTVIPVTGWLIKRLGTLQKEINDLKLHVAEKYATNDYVKEVDGRIMSTLRDVNGKLDRLIERKS